MQCANLFPEDSRPELFANKFDDFQRLAKPPSAGCVTLCNLPAYSEACRSYCRPSQYMQAGSSSLDWKHHLGFQKKLVTSTEGINKLELADLEPTDGLDSSCRWDVGLPCVIVHKLQIQQFHAGFRACPPLYQGHASARACGQD